jgi:hypothetical protein
MSEMSIFDAARQMDWMVASALAWLEEMTPEQRSQFFSALQGHFCTNCGEAGRHITCVCMRDE